MVIANPLAPFTIWQVPTTFAGTTASNPALTTIWGQLAAPARLFSDLLQEADKWSTIYAAWMGSPW